ncbi:hypothetical protein BKA61DRAFT_295822 [Leptodontidium sp. MPI-SDFR-AT-0119]|nr:hypothetical protein BKA61DRAFT_295822 [Leptodontidium sp. MPI-SDFR-AT-0119]
MIYEEVLLGFIWEVGVLDFVQVVFYGNWANKLAAWKNKLAEFGSRHQVYKRGNGIKSMWTGFYKWFLALFSGKGLLLVQTGYTSLVWVASPTTSHDLTCDGCYLEA